jgi:hypothetical protein
MAAMLLERSFLRVLMIAKSRPKVVVADMIRNLIKRFQTFNHRLDIGNSIFLGKVRIRSLSDLGSRSEGISF